MLQVQKKKLDSKIIHSMDKGLEVLERVAQAGELPLSDLAHALNWDKSTVFRLLATLMRRGYIEQNPETKRYRLGFRILYLENQLFRALDLPRVCRDTLARLALKTGESAHLATMQRRQVIVIAQQDSPERVAANSYVGMAEPLHCTALGKALLMQLPPDSLRMVLEGLELKPYTASTITSAEWLQGHIDKVRGQGYATDEDEYDPQIRCLAVPVPVPGSRDVFAIGLSGPASRVTPQRMPQLLEAVQEAAGELQQRFQSPVTTTA